MKAVRHTGIVVRNLNHALYFYRDLLGLKIVKQMVESGSYISRISKLRDVKVTTVKLAAPDKSLIELLHYHSHPSGKPSRKALFETGISHIAFTVKNARKEYTRLRKLGVRFNSQPQVSPDGYAKVVFCRDFEGNPIELVEVLRKK